MVHIGGHYTFDNGNALEKLIMFVIDKGQYIGEDVYYYDTVTLNPLGEVFQKDYEVNFFESKYIRNSNEGEIKNLRSYCPVDIEWFRNKAKVIIQQNWDINAIPEFIIDPEEELERLYLGAYDVNFKAIIFRSEFLILKDIETIEKILIHELCHWYLHITGQSYRDEDVRFAQEVILLGVEDTINIHNAKARKAYEKAKELIK